MHRQAAIQAHTEVITASRNTYAAENHCACGEFLEFMPNYRDPRTCNRCKMRAAILKEIH